MKKIKRHLGKKLAGVAALAALAVVFQALAGWRQGALTLPEATLTAYQTNATAGSWQALPQDGTTNLQAILNAVGTNAMTGTSNAIVLGFDFSPDGTNSLMVGSGATNAAPLLVTNVLAGTQPTGAVIPLGAYYFYKYWRVVYEANNCFTNGGALSNTVSVSVNFGGFTAGPSN